MKIFETDAVKKEALTRLEVKLCSSYNAIKKHSDQFAKAQLSFSQACLTYFTDSSRLANLNVIHSGQKTFDYSSYQTTIETLFSDQIDDYSKIDAIISPTASQEAKGLSLPFIIQDENIALDGEQVGQYTITCQDYFRQMGFALNIRRSLLLLQRLYSEYLEQPVFDTNAFADALRLAISFPEEWSPTKISTERFSFAMRRAEKRRQALKVLDTSMHQGINDFAYYANNQIAGLNIFQVQLLQSLEQAFNAFKQGIDRIYDYSPWRKMLLQCMDLAFGEKHYQYSRTNDSVELEKELVGQYAKSWNQLAEDTLILIPQIKAEMVNLSTKIYEKYERHLRLEAASEGVTLSHKPERFDDLFDQPSSSIVYQ